MIDYRIVLSKNLLDFEKRVNQLKQDGWQVDEIANIEWVGERPYDTYIHILFKVQKKKNTEVFSEDFGYVEDLGYGYVRAMPINIMKEQWEKALKEYKSSEWKAKPTFVTTAKEEPIVFSWDIEKQGNEDLVLTLKDVYKRLGGGYDFVSQASQEQADYEQLLNSVLSISDLDRDKFLEDFEEWYMNSGTAESRLFVLEVVYRSLARGNGLPWEEK